MWPTTFFTFLFLYSSLSFSTDITSYLNQLKDVPVNYGPDGIVCEQVARLELKKQFPEAEYDIAVGVEYFLESRILGEMDLVVVKKATNEVAFIGEVKCWKSFKDGLDKAKTQRELFTWVLQNNPHNIQFRSHEGLSFSATQFQGNIQYATVSQLGGKKYGFTYELPLTLQEFKDLRALLLKKKQK